MNKTKNNGRIDNNDRVLRGGGWYNLSFYCRAAYRDWSAPGNRYNFLGLRLVLPAPPKPERN